MHDLAHVRAEALLQHGLVRGELVALAVVAAQRARGGAEQRGVAPAQFAVERLRGARSDQGEHAILPGGQRQHMEAGAPQPARDLPVGHAASRAAVVHKERGRMFAARTECDAARFVIDAQPQLANQAGHAVGIGGEHRLQVAVLVAAEQDRWCVQAEERPGDGQAFADRGTVQVDEGGGEQAQHPGAAVGVLGQAQRGPCRWRRGRGHGRKGGMARHDVSDVGAQAQHAGRFQPAQAGDPLGLFRPVSGGQSIGGFDQREQGMRACQLFVQQAAGFQRIGQARRQPAGGDEIGRRRTRGALPARRAGQSAPQAGEIGFVGARIAALDGQMKRTFGAQQGRVRWFVALFARMAEAEQPGAQQVGADALEAAAQQGVEPVLEFAGPQRVGDQQRQAERRVARGDECDLGPVRRLCRQQAQDGGCTVRQGLEFEGAEGGRQHAVGGAKYCFSCPILVVRHGPVCDRCGSCVQNLCAERRANPAPDVDAGRRQACRLSAKPRPTSWARLTCSKGRCNSLAAAVSALTSNCSQDCARRRKGANSPWP